MTSAKTSQAPANADQRLSQLIRLKRLEHPSAEFWTEFEQEFRSRQISSFVRVQPLHTRVRRFCLLAARKAAPPAAAVGAVAITIVGVTNTSFLAQSNLPSAANPAENLADSDVAPSEDAIFIVDAKEAVLNAAGSNITSPSLSPEATYQVNLLTKGSASQKSFQILATPVTYTSGSQLQQLGAQVISTKPSY